LRQSEFLYITVVHLRFSNGAFTNCVELLLWIRSAFILRDKASCYVVNHS
jgi:hypothetical protein